MNTKVPELWKIWLASVLMSYGSYIVLDYKRNLKNLEYIPLKRHNGCRHDTFYSHRTETSTSQNVNIVDG